MKTKHGGISSETEVQFELKYCERCGGLWLRPMGGEQIYCGPCWGEMKKLPAVSRSEESAGMRRGPYLGGDGEEPDFDDEDEGEELNLHAVGSAL